jgi:hypothetical protein
VRRLSPWPSACQITDLLSATDDGFSLMSYLRAMFPAEWRNFKERLRRAVGREVKVPDWAEVTELDFGPGARKGGTGGGQGGLAFVGLCGCRAMYIFWQLSALRTVCLPRRRPAV